MHNTLTNLLPIDRQRALARDYLIRLGSVAATLVTVLVVSAGALLVPLYVYLSQTAITKEARLHTIDSTLTSADDASLTARLAALTSDASTLGALASSTSVAATVRSVLAVPRTGISLSALSYTPAATSRTVVLTGTAATRDALSSYKAALEQTPFVRSVTLPVSAFAQETKITFTITLALAP